MLEHDVGDAQPERARSLTRNEARVISSLLGASLESEEARIRASGLPRASYRDAKRRVFAAGMVENRFLPNPSAVGVVKVSFLLTRPFSDRLQKVASRLTQIPGAVVVWSGMQVVLATVFHKGVDQAAAFRKDAEAGQFGNPLALVQADPAEPQVPVYFDFEGLWNRYASIPGTTLYPRPLPLPVPQSSRLGWLGLDGGPAALSSLLRRSEGGGGPPVAPHLLGPAALPRSQRRVLHRGQAQWRIILRPERVLPYRQLALTHVLFVHGKLAKSGALPDFFWELSEQCGVRPFLLASDGEAVLMGSVAMGLGQKLESAVIARSQPPVMPVLSRHLSGLEVIREPLASFSVPRSHQYDVVAPDGGAVAPTDGAEATVPETPGVGPGGDQPIPIPEWPTSLLVALETKNVAQLRAMVLKSGIKKEDVLVFSTEASGTLPGLAGTVFWHLSREEGENNIRPGDLDLMADLILRHFSGGEGRAVAIEGLEIILESSSLKNVRRLLRVVREDAMKYRGRIAFAVNPLAHSTEELALLEEGARVVQ